MNEGGEPDEQSAAPMPPEQAQQHLPGPRASIILVQNWLNQTGMMSQQLAEGLAHLAESQSGNLTRQEYEEMGRVISTVRNLSGYIDQSKAFVGLAVKRLDPTMPVT